MMQLAANLLHDNANVFANSTVRGHEIAHLHFRSHFVFLFDLWYEMTDVGNEIHYI